jgi:chromosome segregation ATPase
MSDDTKVVELDETETTEKVDDTKKFDEVRQRADQEAANARKAREELHSTQSALESAKAETTTLQRQLKEAEAKAVQAGIKEIDLKDEDYDGPALKLVQAVRALNEKITAKDARIGGLEKKVSDYESQLQNEAAQKVRNDTYEELLTDLDKEYGADCRNEAVVQFNALAAEGKVPKGNPAKATRIMEQCYKAVKSEKSKPDKKKPISLDSKGGGTATTLSGKVLKKGSLDEVVKQLASAAKTD